MLAELRVELVDLKRVLAHQRRLQRQDLLTDADPGSAVTFPNPVQAVVGEDADVNVGARGALHRHRLDVPDLESLPLGGDELMVAGQERDRGGGSEELAAGDGLVLHR